MQFNQISLLCWQTCINRLHQLKALFFCALPARSPSRTQNWEILNLRFFIERQANSLTSWTSRELQKTWIFNYFLLQQVGLLHFSSERQSVIALITCGIGCESTTPSVISRRTSYLSWFFEKTRRLAILREVDTEMVCLSIGSELLKTDIKFSTFSVLLLEMEASAINFPLEQAFQSNFLTDWLTNWHHSVPPSESAFLLCSAFQVSIHSPWIHSSGTIFWLSHLFWKNWFKLKRMEKHWILKAVPLYACRAKWVFWYENFKGWREKWKIHKQQSLLGCRDDTNLSRCDGRDNNRRYWISGD